MVMTALAAACTGSPAPTERANPKPDGSTGPSGGAGKPNATAASYRKADCPFERSQRRRRRPRPTSGPTVECGYLTVPERREQTDGKTIELAVATIKATTPTPAADPILYLEGGPGGSALASYDYWTTPPNPLLAQRDIILLDQRGTGYSTPRLSCDQELEDASASATDDEISEACFKRLTQTGVDPDAYDTGASAADVADLRAALGVKEWNLFGVSYGTRLALRVMHDHPDGIRSVVVDSVYPPDVHGIDDQPRNAAASITALLDRCHADAACDRAYPDLRNRFFATVDRLDANPATVDETDPDTGEPYATELTGADLVNASFDTLYDTASLPSLPKALDLAAKGRVSEALDVLADPPSAQKPSAAPESDPRSSEERPDDSDGLFLSVECAEEVPKNSADQVEARSASIDAPLRRALVPGATDLFASCRIWPVKPKPSPVTTSDIPTLVLAGGLDPITPPAWGEQAARDLRRSTFRLFPDAGHSVFDAGPCAQRVVVSFIDQPSSPPDGCTPDPIVFVT